MSHYRVTLVTIVVVASRYSSKLTTPHPIARQQKNGDYVGSIRKYKILYCKQFIAIWCVYVCTYSKIFLGNKLAKF